MIARLLRIAFCSLVLGGAAVAIDAARANDGPVIRDPRTPAPLLRREAVVDSEVVTLGDLVDRCGAACATPLFRAPRPGEAGTIQAQRVAAAAREAGLHDIDAGGATQIVVTRASRAASAEEIERALAEAVAARLGLDAADVAPTLDQNDVRLLLGTGAGSGVVVADMTVEPRARRFTAALVPASARQAAPARVTGFYSESALAPVLTRAVQRGDSIRAEDVAMERRGRDALGEEPVVSAALIVGRVARVALRAGTVLRDRDLAKPILVDRNAVVTVVLDAGALQLTLKGKALEQGSMGETIGVQNMNSKRVIQAVVTGPGAARIPGAGPVARTAAAQP